MTNHLTRHRYLKLRSQRRLRFCISLVAQKNKGLVCNPGSMHLLVFFAASIDVNGFLTGVYSISVPKRFILYSYSLDSTMGAVRLL